MPPQGSAVASAGQAEQPLYLEDTVSTGPSGRAQVAFVGVPTLDIGAPAVLSEARSPMVKLDIGMVNLEASAPSAVLEIGDPGMAVTPATTPAPAPAGAKGALGPQFKISWTKQTKPLTQSFGREKRQKVTLGRPKAGLKPPI